MGRSELVRRLVDSATAETLVLLTASKRAPFYGRIGFKELATKVRFAAQAFSHLPAERRPISPAALCLPLRLISPPMGGFPARLVRSPQAAAPQR